MTSPRRVLIAGGGTAGWLTAAYLARVLGHGKPTCPQITLIESPEIGTIGVGEGSFATIRTTLQTLGLDEETFLREATATFKQGIRFANWETADNWYFHPFDPPYPVEGAGLLPYWLLQDESTRLPFAQELVESGGGVGVAGLAPRNPTDDQARKHDGQGGLRVVARGFRGGGTEDLPQADAKPADHGGHEIGTGGALGFDATAPTIERRLLELGRLAIDGTEADLAQIDRNVRARIEANEKHGRR